MSDISDREGGTFRSTCLAGGHARDGEREGGTLDTDPCVRDIFQMLCRILNHITRYIVYFLCCYSRRALIVVTLYGFLLG